MNPASNNPAIGNPSNKQSVKMWSGRFREPLDAEFEAWQRSIVFDWRLLPQEVAASKAHASALCAAGILTESETAELRDGAGRNCRRARIAGRGQAAVRDHATAEDIHHFVELKLVERLGSLGLKLHTGRSRNEQIATDLRLYVRDCIERTIDGLADWAGALVEQARAAGDAVMPSYTHLQRAEPVLVAHWLLAYVEMALRDADSAAGLRGADELVSAGLGSRGRRNACAGSHDCGAGAWLRLGRQRIRWMRQAIATLFSNICMR